MATGEKIQRKAQNRVARFAVATLPHPVAPSLAREEIISRQRTIVILWTLLLVGLAAVLFFGSYLQASATTAPFVADGGVFGCPVPHLSELAGQ